MTDVLGDIAAAIGKLDSANNTKALLAIAIFQGVSATDIAERGIRRGLEIVGQKYEAGEYFLSELLYAGSLVSDLFEILKSVMKNQQLERKGVIVLGTVRGDIHDIGKNIFKLMAESAGFMVEDLGVDVDPERFVQESKRLRPDTLGLSCLLTTGLPEIEVVTEMLNQAKTRSDLKVLIGGNAVTKEFAQQVGADAAAFDAIQGVEFCRGAIRK